MFSEYLRCDEAKRLLQSGEAVLIDVRQPHEYQEGALPEAVNVPLPRIPYAIDQFKRDTHLILYCNTGHRSGQAKMVLQSMGVDTVHNLGSFRNYFDCHRTA